MDYKRSHSLSSCSSNNSNNLPNGNLLSTNGSNSSNSTNELSNSTISSNDLSFPLINQTHPSLNVIKSPINLIPPNFENQTNSEIILLSNSQFNNNTTNEQNDNYVGNETDINHNGHILYPHPLQTQLIHSNQQLIHNTQIDNPSFNSNHYLNNNCNIYELSNVN